MKHINVLIPASNIVAEHELYQFVFKNNLDIALHFARLSFDTLYGDNQEQYTRELVENIPNALRQLSRIKAEKTVVLCSSAQLFYTGSEDFLFPLNCMADLLKESNVKYPLIITPYNQEIGDRSISELVGQNITPSKAIHLNIKNKDDLLNYSKENLVDTIKQEISNTTDAICVCCTNFATAHLIEQVESELDLPFFSSNSSIMKTLLSLVEK